MDSKFPNFRDLIGIPFVNKGRDPKKGLDCWGCFYQVIKRFGANVPDYDQDCFDGFAIWKLFIGAMDQWEKIDKPEPGCGIAFAIIPEHPDFINHFAIYIGDGKFIHTLETTGVLLSRVDDKYWKSKIRGFYRWKGDRSE